MAEEIQKEHPDWNDDKIFNEARKWVIATYQVRMIGLGDGAAVLCRFLNGTNYYYPSFNNPCTRPLVIFLSVFSTSFSTNGCQHFYLQDTRKKVYKKTIRTNVSLIFSFKRTFKY
jgi:hypothetical protein